MPYTHSEDDHQLDAQVEDFLFFLPFEVNVAFGNRLRLCPPPRSNAYFVLMSLRKSDEPARMPVTNDGVAHQHKLQSGNNVILVNNARLVRPILHKRSGDLLMLDLFAMTGPPPINWFNLTGWNPQFQKPIHPGGHPFWDQLVKLAGAPVPIPYAWDIYNVHAAGAARGVSSESLGLVLPLLQNGFLQTIQSLCANVNPGAASPNAMPAVTVTSEGRPRTLYAAAGAAGAPCPGFAVIAAGAFAPTDSRAVDYRRFGSLASMAHDEVVDFLVSWLLPNHEQRAQILERNRQTRLPGLGIPAEIVYFDALTNALAPAVIN